VKKQVNAVKTGENIARLMRLNHITTYDLQMTLGFQSGTNIYNWLKGRMIPSVHHLVNLSEIFKCPIEEILVIEED